MTTETPRVPVPSLLCGVSGLALAACIALPMSAEVGRSSVLDFLLEAFGEDWLNGLLLVILCGSPYAIGLFVALATFTRGRYGATLLKVPLALLHLEVLVFALFIVHSEERQKAWGLLGFAIVMALRLLGRAARSRSTGMRTTVGWLARSGGIMVAGLFGWFRMHVPGDEIGIALTATIVCAALMAVTARPRG